MVSSASKIKARALAALATAAVWVSARLTAAVAIGLVLMPFLKWMPPFLAPTSTAPVAVVRAVPVPYLDTKPPEAPGAPATYSAKATTAKLLQLVRRSRGQQPEAAPQASEQAETKAAAKGGNADKGDAKAEGDAKAAPQSTPPAAAPPSPSKAAPAAEAKAEAGKAKAPAEPEMWPDTEVATALRDCLRRLAPLGVEIEIAPPVRQDQCGAPAPVVLKRLGAAAGRVELQPPPTLNCAMVASLQAWVEKTLQPAAQELLGSPVVRLRQVSGYVCRHRIGTAQGADKLSEHALANALDVAGFVTADGRTIEVAAKWGPTVRTLREAQEKAWEAVQAAKAALKQAENEASQATAAVAKAEKAKREQAAATAAQKKEELGRKRQEVDAKEADWRKALAIANELGKLTRGAEATKPGAGQPVRPQRIADKKAADTAPPEGAARIEAETVFLRRLHRSACGPFTTVLGPDANEAHHDHFHLDLATRKARAFCE